MADEIGVVLSSPGSTLGSGSVRQPRRIKLNDEQLESISHEDLLKNWRELDIYVEYLESHGPNQEVIHLRECEERIKQQYMESTHREKVLVRRLATKEQEMQDYVSQIAELKSEKAPGAAALRSALLDPAVNLLLQRLRQELITTKARLEETQNELSAWKFTPDSNTGKRLMAKCRLLYQENEELGRIISSGRLAKLEGDLALQKSFSEEVKKSQSELDEFLQDLDEDVEGMQSTIYYLQQELRKAKEELASLQHETEQLKNGSEDNVANKTTVLEVAHFENSKPILTDSAELQSPDHTSSQEIISIVSKPIELDESANLNPPSPKAPVPRQWEDSDDSRELILNIEDCRLIDEPIEETEEAEGIRAGSKRSFESVKEDSPPAKKVRRDSELSLHYSEDEDMMLKENSEEVSTRKSPRTKVSDDDDGSDDMPLSIVRRDSQ